MKITFPWGKGIGTLGFKFETLYFDFSIGGFNGDRHLRLFVVHHEPGAKFLRPVKPGEPRVLDRSWYRLTWRGWKLVKREDRLGEWTRGHRHPALVDKPANPHIYARSFADEWRPYAIRKVGDKKVEVISYPYYESESIRVKVREPNDPTTIHDFVLVNFPEPFPGARERFA